MSRAVTEVSSFKDLSPADATAKLAEMNVAYRGQTPEATTKLAGMLADKGFLSSIDYGGAHGGSDGQALPGGAAFDRLQEVVGEHRAAQGDPVSLAMAGHLDDINESGYLQKKQTVDVLRGMGIGDDAIRQAIGEEPVSREEHARVAQWKKEAMENPHFVAAYLKGDPAAVRQMTHAVIVLTSSIKENAA